MVMEVEKVRKRCWSKFFKRYFRILILLRILFWWPFSRFFYVFHFLQSRNSALQPTQMESNANDVMLFAVQLSVHQKITHWWQKWTVKKDNHLQLQLSLACLASLPNRCLNYLNWKYFGLGNTVILIKTFSLEERISNLHQAFNKKGKESYRIWQSGVRAIIKRKKERNH